MQNKILYLLVILIIILILVVIQHYFPNKSVYDYISRHIGPLNQQKRQKLKQTKVSDHRNDPQLPSKDAGPKMVKGKLSNDPYKIRDTK